MITPRFGPRSGDSASTTATAVTLPQIVPVSHSEKYNVTFQTTRDQQHAQTPSPLTDAHSDISHNVADSQPLVQEQPVHASEAGQHLPPPHLPTFKSTASSSHLQENAIHEATLDPAQLDVAYPIMRRWQLIRAELSLEEAFMLHHPKGPQKNIAPGFQRSVPRTWSTILGKAKAVDTFTDTPENPSPRDAVGLVVAGGTHVHEGSLSGTPESLVEHGGEHDIAYQSEDVLPAEVHHHPQAWEAFADVFGNMGPIFPEAEGVDVREAFSIFDLPETGAFTEAPDIPVSPTVSESSYQPVEKHLPPDSQVNVSTHASSIPKQVDKENIAPAQQSPIMRVVDAFAFVDCNKEVEARCKKRALPGAASSSTARPSTTAGQKKRKRAEPGALATQPEESTRPRKRTVKSRGRLEMQEDLQTTSPTSQSFEGIMMEDDANSPMYVTCAEHCLRPSPS